MDNEVSTSRYYERSERQKGGSTHVISRVKLKNVDFHKKYSVTRDNHKDMDQPHVVEVL